ncbi:MAG: dCMP deaminase family protein [Agathobacter sp.]|nr:dCMP deaminase family protein [Agathobacter sp.]
MEKKRENVLDWDSTFMGIAKLIAMRSKDPNTQVGAVIVGKDKRILSLGYNGLPAGMSDDEDVWNRDGEDELRLKYTYVCHAEENAILNYRGDFTALSNSTIYVSLFPCNNCAKMIAQSGIKEVVYESDKYGGTPLNIASKKILKSAGVKCRRVEKTIDVNVSFSDLGE